MDEIRPCIVRVTSISNANKPGRQSDPRCNVTCSSRSRNVINFRSERSGEMCLRITCYVIMLVHIHLCLFCPSVCLSVCLINIWFSTYLSYMSLCFSIACTRDTQRHLTLNKIFQSFYLLILYDLYSLHYWVLVISLQPESFGFGNPFYFTSAAHQRPCPLLG